MHSSDYISVTFSIKIFNHSSESCVIPAIDIGLHSGHENSGLN